MVAVIIQLQQDALNRNILVSDLLRKALVVTKKVELNEFQEWINKELSGYGKREEVPEYRDVKGDVRGLNPYTNHWMPLFFEDSKMGETCSHRKVSQSIAELEHLVDSDGEWLQMPFSQEIQKELSKGFGFQTQVSLFCTNTSVIKIIDTVRTIILNWAIKLEKDGVLGEDLSFTPQERELASKSTQIISNFYGPVQHQQIQQGNEKAVQVQVQATHDSVLITKLLEQLKVILPVLDLTSELKSEINSEVQTIEAQLKSPKPKPGIINESLRSVRTILEGAASSAAGQLIIDIGKLLLG